MIYFGNHVAKNNIPGFVSAEKWMEKEMENEGKGKRLEGEGRKEGRKEGRRIKAEGRRKQHCIMEKME